ncbi:MAG: zinc dependent phospholipase C family protein [Oscillospiraceae bacterium]|nr:zinc dependent phospholipase C family protein [Oscillospiraceae bacterium]MDD4413200.1 zinc dependent phospholipase C family protein [Oscillospiraceae bacterium]
MKVRIHRYLARHIREGCEGRLNIKINPYWFEMGSIYPDISHQRILRMHEIGDAGGMVGRMIRRFCNKSIYSGQNLSRWRSLRLGVIMHYLSDFLCYAHTVGFEGNLRQHCSYEQIQGELNRIPHVRDICSFYGVEYSADLFEELKQVIRERTKDSFSPDNDLDYALSIGTEIAYAMLRISMGVTARPPLRYRIPIIGPRLLSNVLS